MAGRPATPAPMRWLTLRARLARWLLSHWQGPEPDAVARALQPLAALYGAIERHHRRRYQREPARRLRAPVPVIVVGNAVAGGAGKTPAVLALVPRLRALGFTPGVVSRGHGRTGDAVRCVEPGDAAAEVGDEPLLIRRRSGAPVAVGRDRVAAARHLCQHHPEVDVVVSDDGLQHHRLHRDLELLLLDDRGLGNGLVLPAGPLRQPVDSLKPAAAPTAAERGQAPPRLILYTHGRPSTPWPGHLGHRRLAGLLPLADWWAGATALGGFDALRGRPVLSAAGLARPQRFFDDLSAQGLQVQPLPLPDHAPLDPLPWPTDTPDVVLTEKDAIKLPPDAGRRASVGHGRIWVATLDFAPDPGFDAALARAVADWPRRAARPSSSPHPDTAP